MENLITAKYLRENPTHIFVFGDNLARKGKGGSAALRDEKNTYGFITKKAPNNDPESFYTKEEYAPVLKKEMAKLIKIIKATPHLTYLIPKLGSGLANRYGIWDMIKPQLLLLAKTYPNVRLLETKTWKKGANGNEEEISSWE